MKVFVLFVLSVIVFASCQDQQMEDLNVESQSKPLIVLDPDPECNIIGDDWDGDILTAGDTKSYSIESHASATYDWVATDDLEIISGEHSASVTVKVKCVDAVSTSELFVSRVISGQGICSNQGTVTILPSTLCDAIECPGDPQCYCSCPDPSISVSTCNSTNGFLLAQVIDVEPGDDFVWTGSSNVKIQNGKYSKNVAAYIYGSADFTISCKVTRVCNGTTYSRTVNWYSNASQGCQYYGTNSNNCVIN